jgi:hypothetical protein
MFKSIPYVVEVKLDILLITDFRSNKAIPLR